MKSKIKPILLSLCLIVVLGIFIRGISTSIPSDRITIYSGAVGGTFYQTALHYREALTSLGFEVSIRPTDDATKMLERVNAGEQPNSIGFMMGKSDETRYPNIRSLGFVGIQPLFLFYSSAYGRLISLATLKGRDIVMPPKDSVATQMALSLLSLYDITPENTNIVFLPFRRAVAAVRSGDAYAVFLMLGAEHPVIEELMQDSELNVFSYTDTAGILKRLKNLTTVSIASGGYDVLRQIPPRPLELLAAQIEIIANQNLDKAAAYALLDTFKNVHYSFTLTQVDGAYPAFIGALTRPYEVVPEFAKAGTPWLYRTLPNIFAVLIDKYLIIGLAIFLLAEIYRVLRYLYELLALTAEAMALSIIKHNLANEKAGKRTGLIGLIFTRWAGRVVKRKSLKQKAADMLTDEPQKTR